MSWLNFNESISNIKGQISSFASGVLAEGIVNDTDPFTELAATRQKIQELQNLCASQEVEITTLRRQNSEFYEKISFDTKVKTETHENVDSNGENCFWDPPTSGAQENTNNTTISDLTNRIQSLEIEKQDLIQNLEQLDQDCQKTTAKLISLKDNLQTDYTKLKTDYEWLKTENECLLKENSKLNQEFSKLKSEQSNESIIKSYETKIENLEKDYTKLKNDYEWLKTENECLLKENSKLNQEFSKLKSEQSNESIIKSYETKIENLETDYTKLKNDYEWLKTENECLLKENSKLNQEFSKLKSEQSNESIIKSYETKIENLEKDDTKLKNDYEWLKTENECLLKENSKLNQEFSKLKSEQSNESIIKSYETKIENLEKDDTKLKNDYEWLKTENECLLKENSKLNQEFSKLKSEQSNESIIKSYETKIENLEKDDTKLKNDYEWLKTENECLLKENSKLNQEFSKLKSEQSNESIIKSYETKIENLEKDDTKLKNDYEWLKTENECLLKENSKLNQEFSKLKSEQSNESIIKSYETKIENLEKDKENWEKLNAESVPADKFNNLLKDFENLQKSYSELENKLQSTNNEIDTNECKYLPDSNNLHKQYVNILTEMVKKYVDYDIPEDFVQKQNETTEISEFTSKTESVLKLLLDFKWETEMVQRKLCEISHEKTVAITEKNHEIEKLLHNSEILSQEVITKTQTIKDYELESSELIKNNNLLITELKQYKNNNGLQTISETNEDNVLFLETQLENANKRIRELELVINDMENAKQDVALETQTELDYIKKQLNLTGRELSQSKKEYQELLKSYKQSENDNATINNTFINEKQNLEMLVEKLKMDLENLEYKFTESNVNVEMLKEELNNSKNELETNEQLQNNNKELENKIQLLQKELELLKSQFDSVVTIRNEIELQNRNLTEKLQSSKMSETGLRLQNDTIKKELDLTIELNTSLDQKIKNYERDLIDINLAFQQLKIDNDNLTVVEKMDFLKNHYKDLEENLSRENDEKLDNKIKDLENRNLEIQNQIQIILNNKTELEKLLSEERNKSQLLTSQIEELNSKLIELNNSKIELTNFLKTKHEENVQYHSEIQRLNEIISSSAQQTAVSIDQISKMEKLVEENNFLKEKCENLSKALLEEQSNYQKILSDRQAVAEREQSLAKELERLRLHLVNIEDSYTKDLLLAEKKNEEMQTKVSEIEKRERNSSTIYTSVSIRANQQVETLQNQLHLVTNQRDDLQKKISEAEDKNNKQFAALTNLQCVLEQFQREREKDIINETERIRRQITVEQHKQTELQDEINTLKAQFEESKQGLKAAARLTEQIEENKQNVVAMKEEVVNLQSQLSKTEEKYKQLLTQTDVKVDKNLIKNLIVGFISSNNQLNNQQTQILKIIATVLDFSQQDNEKLNLHKGASGSWLSAILHPVAGNSNLSQQSLSEAFVRFLENESQVKPAPPPLINMRKMSTDSNASTSSSIRQSSVGLSEVILPTFADFAQNRNSSSILKDVLKEN